MKLKPKVKMLRDLCKQISDLEDSYLSTNEGCVEAILSQLVSGLEIASQEDYFGTEGWEHAFGYGD